jgi:hypothetical protein
MQITTIFMCTAYTALAADLGLLELLPDPVALLRRGARVVLRRGALAIHVSRSPVALYLRVDAGAQCLR